MFSRPDSIRRTDSICCLLAATLLLAAAATEATIQDEAAGDGKPDELVGLWTLSQLDMDLVKVDSLDGARAEMELRSRLVEGTFEVDVKGAIAGLGAVQYFVDIQAGGTEIPNLPKIEGRVTLAEAGIREFTFDGTADFEAGTITLDSFEVIGGPLQCHEIFATGGGGPTDFAAWPPMAEVVAVKATGGNLQATGNIGAIQVAIAAFKGAYTLIAEDQSRDHGERKGNPLHMVTGRCKIRPSLYMLSEHDPRQAEVAVQVHGGQLPPGVPTWSGTGISGAAGARTAQWLGNQDSTVRAYSGAGYEEAEIKIHDLAQLGNCVHLTEPPRSPAEKTLGEFEKWMKDFIAIKATSAVLECSDVNLDTVYVCVDKYDSPEVDTASFFHGRENKCIGIGGEIGLKLKIKGVEWPIQWALDATASSRWVFAELWLDPSRPPDLRYRGTAQWSGALKLNFVPATAEIARQAIQEISNALGWDVQAIVGGEAALEAKILGIATPGTTDATAQVKLIARPKAKLVVRTPQAGTVTNMSGVLEGFTPGKSFKISVTLRELLDQIQTQGTCQ